MLVFCHRKLNSTPCTTPNRELGIASCFAQMVCTTPNRELGIASYFAQMVCTTPNRELRIASCLAQMVCTTPNRELGIASCFAQIARSSKAHWRLKWLHRPVTCRVSFSLSLSGQPRTQRSIILILWCVFACDCRYPHTRRVKGSLFLGYK